MLKDIKKPGSTEYKLKQYIIDPVYNFNYKKATAVFTLKKVNATFRFISNQKFLKEFVVLKHFMKEPIFKTKLYNYHTWFVPKYISNMNG